MRTFLSLAALACVLSSCSVDLPTTQSASATVPIEDTLPGSLISQRAVAASALIPGAASGINFRYRSTDGLDGTSPITVSGAIYLPQGEAPAGGWPLIAWSHGTVGIADACAPSSAGRSQRDLTYLSNWLRKGYAIVASDYQGLGTEGTHPYMAARPMAYSNLDAIRAVQQGGFPVSRTVVVTGQSQGAAAAIATAGFAPDYAPEIDLRAISATGVPYFPPAVQQMMAALNQDTPNPQVAFTAYLLTMAELVDPSFDFESTIASETWPAVSKAYDQCVGEFIGSTMAAGVTPRDLVSPESLAVQEKVFATMAYPTLALSVPAFVGTGEADQITPLPMQQLFVRDACAAGSRIEARQYPGANHDGGLLNSMDDVEAFVARAFAGVPQEGNCP